MSRKTRKAYTAEEKVAILRRHLLDHVPVSDLCDEYHLHPTQFYRWQRQFFENGATALAGASRSATAALETQIAALRKGTDLIYTRKGADPFSACNKRVTSQ